MSASPSFSSIEASSSLVGVAAEKVSVSLLGEVQQSKRLIAGAGAGNGALLNDRADSTADFGNHRSLNVIPEQLQATSIRNAKDYENCGDAFRQYLDRHPDWISLKAEVRGLVPYSLRHGYAWRGAKYYNRSIPIRDLAALMGHTVKTHQKHYGQWTSDEDTKESVLRAVGDLKTTLNSSSMQG